MNQVTTQEAFQETIKSRLREDVGKLMPDDMLAKLVEQAIKEMFFKRIVDNSGYRAVEKPSWFEAEVASQLRARTAEQLKAWFVANDATLRTQVIEAIREQLPAILGMALLQGFSGFASYQGSQMMAEIVTTLRNKGVGV